MNRIGILTFQRTSNFGSVLQSLALVKAIEKANVECEIIDYRSLAIENREYIGKFKIEKSIKSNIINLLSRPSYIRKYNNLHKFLLDNAAFSPMVTRENIGKIEDRYSKIIVGSDIVWGLDVTDSDYTYFLDFVSNNEKKYAFSSSAGNYKYTDKMIGTLLQSFRKIAVREEEGIEWIVNLSGKKAELVCDPTMLLSATEWDKFVHPVAYEDEYVLVYFDNDDGKCLNDSLIYAEQHCLKVKYVAKTFKPIKHYETVFPETIGEFIGLIKSARAVFTASYHGILFSLYYHVPLFYYTRAHSSRMESLSKILDLDSRRFNTRNIINDMPYDIERIDRAIESFREKSIHILQEMINE